MEIDANEIVVLTSLVLAAALDPGQWLPFLERFREVLGGGTRPHIFGRDLRTGRLIGFIDAGGDPEKMAEYDSYYRHHNVWVDAFVDKPKGAMMRVAEMYPTEELVKTEFYNGWLKPQEDMIGGIGVKLFKEPDRFFSFGVNIRARDIERLDAPTESLVRLLTPHVQQAFEINRAMAGKTAEAAVLGRLDIGFFLLGEEGRIFYANDFGEGMLGLGGVVRCDLQHRLRSPVSGISRFLNRALFALEDVEDIAPLEAVVRLEGGHRKVRLRAARFFPENQRSSPFGAFYTGSQRILMLTVETEEEQDEVVEGMLRRHGLTAAEIEIAMLLAEGLSVAEIAERRGVRLSTVHNQRHTILQKLEFRRQSQLFRLIHETRLRG